MSESTHVQTELTDEEYRHFKSLARERGLSLRSALHEAAEVWMKHQEQVDPDDPLFEILEQLDEESGPEQPRTNAAMEDDLVEEWDGSSVDIRLSEAPDSED